MLPDAIGKPLRSFAATRAGARVYRATLPVLDRAFKAASGGKRTFTELVLPTLVLTSTGRRSGEARRQPLIYVEVEGGYAVVGTNWGQEHHPAWTHNLLADPAATVEIGRDTIAVTARLAEGPERDEIYGRFERLSPNYTKYKDWSGGRQIRVMVLERR